MANPLANAPENDSQQNRCRWLGPTPEMLFWWIEGECPLLNYFGQAFPLPKTAADAARCLKPLHEIQTARSEKRVDENLVYLLPEDQTHPGVPRRQPLIFFIDELTQSLGGIQAADQACQSCRFNTAKPKLGGCSGLLIRANLKELGQQSVRLSDDPRPISIPKWTNDSSFEVPWWATLTDQLINSTDLKSSVEAWYRFAATPHWNKQQLLEIGGLKLAKELLEDPDHDLRSFANAIETAVQQDKPLHFTHICRGFSDGHDWWIGPHCFNCHAPMTETDRRCWICRHESGPVPAQKRRVMGWNPYWPMHALVSKQDESRLVERWREATT